MRVLLQLCLFSGVTLGACDVVQESPGVRMTSQAAVGPSNVTASSTVVGQVDVTWTAEPPAFKYYVYQSAGGGAFTFAQSVLTPPSGTAYTATGLNYGVQYCYEIQAAFPDGTNSDMSAPACSLTSGSAVASARHVTLGADEMRPLSPSSAVFFGTHWRIDQDSTQAYFPVSIPVGCAISGWSVTAQKGAAASLMLAAFSAVNFTMITTLSSVSAAGQVGTLTLSSGLINHVISSDVSYAVIISRDSTSSQDLIYRAGIDYICPD